MRVARRGRTQQALEQEHGLSVWPAWEHCFEVARSWSGCAAPRCVVVNTCRARAAFESADYCLPTSSSPRSGHLGEVGHEHDFDAAIRARDSGFLLLDTGRNSAKLAALTRLRGQTGLDQDLRHRDVRARGELPVARESGSS